MAWRRGGRFLGSEFGCWILDFGFWISDFGLAEGDPTLLSLGRLAELRRVKRFGLSVGGWDLGSNNDRGRG